jgi:DNA polymerase III delta prime subunit
VIYKISDIIRYASTEALTREPLKSEYLEAAVELVKKSIIEGRISLVQGPPGTGKTTVFELSINELFDSISSDYLLLYVAPTNKLVADMMKRIAKLYCKSGKIGDITEEVRIYGSLFEYNGYEKMRDKVDRNVKMILSTDYQRPYFASNKQICLLVDEASKTPLHQPFISMTGKIIRTVGRSELHCLSVIGDPKQAITLGPEYRDEGERLLILNNLIRGHLREIGKEPSDDPTEDARRYLRGSVYEFLETTYRMPRPTEAAISEAYYGGMLRAAYTVQERLKDAWDQRIASKLSAKKEKLKKAVQISEEAITTSRGISYIKVDSEYPYSEEENAVLFEERRAEAGIYLAACLSSITRMKCAVLTTYTDQWQQMKLMFQKNIVPIVRDAVPNIQDLVSFGTVDKHLGSEEEIVVCILGKESSTLEKPTRYFQEPELLNVQLSRHRRLMCIVGNLLSLRNTARKLDSESRTHRFNEIARAAEILMDQAGFELRGRTARRVRTGDACVYSEWP